MGTTYADLCVHELVYLLAFMSRFMFQSLFPNLVALLCVSIGLHYLVLLFMLQVMISGIEILAGVLTRIP
jgi:hypothetical protein